MDKALASGAGDCGFESHCDRYRGLIFFFLFCRLFFFCPFFTVQIQILAMCFFLAKHISKVLLAALSQLKT